MVEAGYTLVKITAEKKINFYKQEKASFFVSSMMSGFFVGICMIAINVIAGALGGFSGIKIVQGVTFAAALSFVIFAGADLFTGNIFIMTAGVMQKSVKSSDAVLLCAFCYIGNLAGSVLAASLFFLTGFLQGATLETVHAAVLIKTQPYFFELFTRGVFCNILVCLAVWCTFRMQSESGKLIMIFWCIFVFIICGFEHSIANMTLFSMAAISGAGADVILKMLVNLGAATTGNITGGMALALAYWFIAKKALAKVSL